MPRGGLAANKARIEQRFIRGRIKGPYDLEIAGSRTGGSCKSPARQLPEALLGLGQPLRVSLVKKMSAITRVVHYDMGSHGIELRNPYPQSGETSQRRIVFQLLENFASNGSTAIRASILGKPHLADAKTTLLKECWLASRLRVLRIETSINLSVPGPIRLSPTLSSPSIRRAALICHETGRGASTSDLRRR